MRFFYCLVVLFLVLPFKQVQAQKNLIYELDADYRNALELFDKEKYTAAQTLFAEIDRKIPNYLYQKLPETEQNILKMNVQFYEAVCAYELYNNNIEYLLTRFISNYPENPRAKEAMFYMMKYHFRANRFKRAINWIDKINPKQLASFDRPEFYFKKAYCAFIAKNYTDALENFRLAKTVATKYSFPATYYVAYILYVQEQYAEALEEFLNLKESTVYADIYPFYVTDIYYRMGRYDEAIDYGRGVLKANQVTKYAPPITRIVANCYFKKSVYDNSLFYYKKYLATDSAKRLIPQDKYQIGYCYYQTADFESAIHSFEKLAEEDNIYGQYSLYTLADCFLKKKDKQAARNSFWKASKIERNKSIQEESLLNYAKLSYELDFHLVALSSVRKFIDDFPNSEYINDAKSLLVELLVNTKNYREALEVCETLPNRSTRLTKAYQKIAYFRGVELYNDNRKEDAFQLFGKAIEIEADYKVKALANFWRAEIFLDRKNWDQAIANYEAFLSNPMAQQTDEYELGYYGAGYALFQKEKYVEAAYYFEKYVKNTGENTKITKDAILRLGDCSFILKDYAKAINAYDKIIFGKYTGSDYALFQKGIIQGLQNQFKEKLATHRQLLNDFPKSIYADDALYEMAYTNFITNNTQEARAGFAEVITKYPESSYAPKALLNTGLMYYNMSDDSNAIFVYKKLVNSYPRSDEAQESLQAIKNIYIEKGNTDEFFAYSKTVPFANFSSGTQDTVTYKAANNRYMRNDCETAVPAFSRYLERFGDGAFSIDAHYQRAECLIKNKNLDEAAIDLKYIIEKEKNKYTEKALLNYSRVLIAQNKSGEAINYLKELENDAEYKASYAYAITRLMKAYEMQGELDNAADYAHKIIDFEKSSSEDINRAQLTLGKVFLAKADTAKALEKFRLLVSSTKTISGAEAKYLIATVFFGRNDYANSQQTLFSLINQIPTYDYWIGKAYILLADNYTKLGNTFQAKSTLQSIIENYKEVDDIKHTASKKLQALLDLEKPAVEPENPEGEFDNLLIEIDGLEDDK